MKRDFLNSSFLQELDLFISQNYVEDESAIAKSLTKEESDEIEHFTKNNKKGFIETLDEMREKYNEGKKEKLNSADLYNKINVTRQTYYKLREKDRPSKDTAISFALGLELCESDMEVLLASAGWSLATNSKRDLIIKFCFVKKIYEYSYVCEILKAKGEKLFRNL